MTGRRDTSDDGPSPLEAAAITMHELYRSLTVGGFTRREALHIVAEVIIGRRDGDDL